MPTPATLVFYGLAALTLSCAAGVAFSRNLLHAALLLLGALVGTAGLYLYIGADFLGMAQLLIYVGGILVLLLFAVLLTNKIGEVRLSNRSVGKVVAVLAALAGGGALAWLLASAPWEPTEAVAAPTTARLGEAFLSEQLLPFELVSLLLLVALVGATLLARRAVAGGGPRAGSPPASPPV